MKSEVAEATCIPNLDDHSMVVTNVQTTSAASSGRRTAVEAQNTVRPHILSSWSILPRRAEGVTPAVLCRQRYTSNHELYVRQDRSLKSFGLHVIDAPARARAAVADSGLVAADPDVGADGTEAAPGISIPSLRDRALTTLVRSSRPASRCAVAISTSDIISATSRIEIA